MTIILFVGNNPRHMSFMQNDNNYCLLFNCYVSSKKKMLSRKIT